MRLNNTLGNWVHYQEAKPGGGGGGGRGGTCVPYLNLKKKPWCCCGNFLKKDFLCHDFILLGMCSHYFLGHVASQNKLYPLHSDSQRSLCTRLWKLPDQCTYVYIMWFSKINIGRRFLHVNCILLNIQRLKLLWLNLNNRGPFIKIVEVGHQDTAHSHMGERSS